MDDSGQSADMAKGIDSRKLPPDLPVVAVMLRTFDADAEEKKRVEARKTEGESTSSFLSLWLCSSCSVMSGCSTNS